MSKTIIKRGAVVLAAAAAGGALAVLPSASLASGTSHSCGNPNAHTRNVRADNTTCRKARYWAVRNRCPRGWQKSGTSTTSIGGGSNSSSPPRYTCRRGRAWFAWTHTSGSSGSGSGTITIG